MNNQFQQVLDIVAKHCDADDYILNVRKSSSSRARFAVNGITQHMAGTDYYLSLQTAYGNKTGNASVTGINQQAIIDMVEQAQQIAKLNQPDPEHMPSMGPQQVPALNNYSAATAGLKSEQLVDTVAACVDFAKAKNATIAGMTEYDELEEALFTKNGFVGTDHSTDFSHSMTFSKDAIETKVSCSMKDVSEFNVNNELNRLQQQVDSLGKPQGISPGRWTVILRPHAVLDILSYLLWMMDRRQADEGLSPYSGQLGKNFFGKNFTLASRLNDESLLAKPFNHEGVPGTNVDWIKNGVLINQPTDRYWASQQGINPMYVPNIVIDGGNATEQQMMQQVKRGLIINRFWYIRQVDFKRGELTGMTRDGVTMFEDGVITKPVFNLRFNEIPHEFTRRILALGKNITTVSWAKMPTMLVEDFNFVDTTTF